MDPEKECVGTILILTMCVLAEYLQSCLTLCDPSPRNCRPPGSSVHGVLQARILEWVRIELASVASPALPGGFFTTSTTWEAQL